MDIFELAIAKKMFGNGGGGKREGTAIPIGKEFEFAYLNTGISAEEIDAYLSSLTYVQTDLTPLPVYAIYAYVDPAGNGYTGKFIFVMKSNNSYTIAYATDLLDADNGSTVIYSGGWICQNAVLYDKMVLSCLVGSIYLQRASISDFGGLPIGAENEKIKNVLSITPF